MTIVNLLLQDSVTNLQYAKPIILLMQNPSLYFTPQPIILYKIVSVIDQNKAFTITRDQKLVLGDFTATPNQRFHVYVNNGKYAFVAENYSALYVMNDNAKNGAVIIADPSQHKSSFFDITPVTSGPWAGKACYIRTVNGKALNINGAAANNGADVYQWDLQGGNNQCWVVKQAILQPYKSQQNQMLQNPRLSIQEPKKSTEQTRQSQLNNFQNMDSLQKYKQSFQNYKQSLQKSIPMQNNSQIEKPRNFSIKKLNQSIQNPEPLHYKLESLKPKQSIILPKLEKKLGTTEVPAQFVPDSNTNYRIVNILNPNKAFTVSKNEGKLVISDYTGDNSQKFKIIQNGKKFSFVAQSNNFNLCVLKDSQDYGATLIASPSKQSSSKFQIVRNSAKGQWRNKGYIIKTNVNVDNMVLDLSASTLTNGNQIIQWDLHGGGNQIWIFAPIQQQNFPSDQPKQVGAEVPAEFVADSKATYKIVNALNPNKAFTISKNQGKLIINDFTGDASQKFKIAQNGKNFNFVVQSNNFNLCVLKDSQENGAALIASPGKQISSKFQIIRNSAKGQLQNKGYLIKATQNMFLNLSNLANGSPICQSDRNNSGNQTWLIVPVSSGSNYNESEFQTVSRWIMMN